jgi:hypothetical protein
MKDDLIENKWALISFIIDIINNAKKKIFEMNYIKSIANKKEIIYLKD